MKKFGKLIGLLLMIILTLTIYYTHIHSLTDRFAQFEIEHVTGDEKVIEDVSIYGDLQGAVYSHEPLKLSIDGTTYLREEPLFKRYNFYYEEEYALEIQKKYRNFMRGKLIDEDALYETNEYIYYVDIPMNRWGIVDGYIELSVLHKPTKKQKTYEIESSKLEGYPLVTATYVNDDEVHIILEDETYNTVTGEFESMTALFYTFDLGEEQLVAKEDLSLNASTDYGDVFRILPNDETKPTKFLITQSAFEFIEKESNDEIHVEEKGELISVYEWDLQTKELTDIFDHLPSEAGIPIAYSETAIVFADLINNQAHFNTYNIKEENITDSLSIELKGQNISYWDLYDGIERDGYFYSLFGRDIYNESTIVVVQLSSLELVYEGEIVSTVESQQSSLEQIDANFYKLTIYN